MNPTIASFTRKNPYETAHHTIASLIETTPFEVAKEYYPTLSSEKVYHLVSEVFQSIGSEIAAVDYFLRECSNTRMRERFASRLAEFARHDGAKERWNEGRCRACFSVLELDTHLFNLSKLPVALIRRVAERLLPKQQSPADFQSFVEKIASLVGNQTELLQSTNYEKWSPEQFADYLHIVNDYVADAYAEIFCENELPPDFFGQLVDQNLLRGLGRHLSPDKTRLVAIAKLDFESLRQLGQHALDLGSLRKTAFFHHLSLMSVLGRRQMLAILDPFLDDEDLYMIFYQIGQITSVGLRTTLVNAESKTLKELYQALPTPFRDQCAAQLPWELKERLFKELYVPEQMDMVEAELFLTRAQIDGVCQTVEALFELWQETQDSDTIVLT